MSEYSSGFEMTANKFKNSSFASNTSSLFPKAANKFSNQSTDSSGGAKPEKKPPVKIVKKNMAIFD